MIQDVYQWLVTAGQVHSEKNVNLAISLIEEELQELKEAWVDGNRKEFLDAVIDLYWVVTNAAYFAGEPYTEVQSYVDKVSVSNWSKFCKNEQEAIDTCDAYRNGNHWDKLGTKINCDYVRCGSWWIVKREDGKILKSINYLPVEKL